MKRPIIIFSAIAALTAVGCGKRLPTNVPQQANSVDRRVVMELFTATWCSNCPTADAALEKLAKELGNSITVIQYHPLSNDNPDPLATSQTDARGQFYGVGAWPTLWCDGLTSQVGITQDTYQNYAVLARNRLLINSPLEVDLSGRVVQGSLEYSVKLTARAYIESSDLRLLVMVLEDSVFSSASTQVQRFVCRMIEPDVQGLPVSLSFGSIQTKQGKVPIDTVNWRKDRLWVAAIVQSFYDRQILQSDMLNLSLPVWDFSISVDDTIKTSAQGEYADYPMTIKNDGNQPDTFWVNLPDSLVQPSGTVRILKATDGSVITMPAGFYLEPGDSARYTVSMSSSQVDSYRGGVVAWPGKRLDLTKTVYLRLNVVTSIVYDYQVSAADTIMIASIGDIAEFPVVIRNMGNQNDSIYLDLPDSLSTPSNLIRSICDTRGYCYPMPLVQYSAAGDSITNLVIHLQSYSAGSCEAFLTLRSKGDPALMRKLRLLLEVVK